jgi:hypothetical protein
LGPFFQGHPVAGGFDLVKTAFTGPPPDCGKFAFDMMWLLKGRAARALALGLMAAALTACASTPAPVYPGLRGRTPALAAIPYDPSAPPHVADAGAKLQCVPYARQISGVEIYGDANTWWARAEGRYPRSTLPASGAVLVVRGFYGPGRGHVAVVREVVGQRLLRVDHANWLNRGEISVSVPVMDVSPNNDWSQIRVWHIPGGHWGGRVYQVEGFIHPFSYTAMMG